MSHATSLSPPRQLRAALAVSAASEEAARLETDGLRRQLAEYRAEEQVIELPTSPRPSPPLSLASHVRSPLRQGRFTAGLRQQAEQMRLHRRIASLAEEGSGHKAAVVAAGVEVACLRADLERSEAQVASCASPHLC